MAGGMKKNLNFGLLILIIAALICFSAAAVYYQNTFKVLNKETTVKLSELQRVTSTLLEKKQELAETTANKQSLESKYTDVKQEKESVEQQLDDTKNDLESTRTELLQTKDDLRKEKDLSALYMSQRDEYKAEADAYKSDVNSLCDIISGTNITIPDECDEG